jgi:hypothetical protein
MRAAIGMAAVVAVVLGIAACGEEKDSGQTDQAAAHCAAHGTPIKAPIGWLPKSVAGRVPEGAPAAIQLGQRHGVAVVSAAVFVGDAAAGTEKPEADGEEGHAQAKRFVCAWPTDFSKGIWCAEVGGDRSWQGTGDCFECPGHGCTPGEDAPQTTDTPSCDGGVPATPIEAGVQAIALLGILTGVMLSGCSSRRRRVAVGVAALAAVGLAFGCATVPTGKQEARVFCAGDTLMLEHRGVPPVVLPATGFEPCGCREGIGPRGASYVVHPECKRDVEIRKVDGLYVLFRCVNGCYAPADSNPEPAAAGPVGSRAVSDKRGF